MTRALLVAVALLGVGACVEPEERPVSWPALHATVIEPSCATAACHAKLTSQDGIDLSTPDAAYAILLGRTCHGDDPAPPGEPVGSYVFPGDPARSRLIHLLVGEDVGTRMPPDRALPAGEIALVERWILEGAPCD